MKGKRREKYHKGNCEIARLMQAPNWNNNQDNEKDKEDKKR